MTHLIDQRTEKQRDPVLRSQIARAEKILWSRLKGNRLLEYKFQRQHSIGVFTLDFYSQQCRLAIEIAEDTRLGDRHEEYNRRRRQYIELYEIALIRFTGAEVCNNIDGVTTKIVEVAKRRSGVRPLAINQLRPLQIG
ncbi:MAG TPA: DUF559 domain-containing protein, partial [Bacteroidota bacterium]|nr:DUF559 domain-containing protein [Bacteroidota bacterium]